MRLLDPRRVKTGRPARVVSIRTWSYSACSASTTRRRAVELRMSPRRGVQDRRYVSCELRRGSPEPFTVRIEREADVPLVVDGLNRRGTEQRSLLVERLDALR
jgi:hypothetical protein